MKLNRSAPFWPVEQQCANKGLPRIFWIIAIAALQWVVKKTKKQAGTASKLSLTTHFPVRKGKTACQPCSYHTCPSD